VNEFSVMLVLGALGLLAAWVERRDGLRLAEHQSRTDREAADLRERVALLEHRVGELERADEPSRPPPPPQEQPR
jgi:hypothetical protein